MAEHSDSSSSSSSSNGGPAYLNIVATAYRNYMMTRATLRPGIDVLGIHQLECELSTLMQTQRLGAVVQLEMDLEPYFKQVKVARLARLQASSHNKKLNQKQNRKHKSSLQAITNKLRRLCFVTNPHPHQQQQLRVDRSLVQAGKVKVVPAPDVFLLTYESSHDDDDDEDFASRSSSSIHSSSSSSIHSSKEEKHVPSSASTSTTPTAAGLHGHKVRLAKQMAAQGGVDASIPWYVFGTQVFVGAKSGGRAVADAPITAAQLRQMIQRLDFVQLERASSDASTSSSSSSSMDTSTQ
jgi:hypothetical protein